MFLWSYAAACWALMCGQYLALVSAVTPRRSPALPASITKGRVQPPGQQQQQPLLLTATPGSHNNVSSPSRGSVGAATVVNGDHTRPPRHHHDVDYTAVGASANVYPFVGTGTQLYTSTTGPGYSTTLYYPQAVTGDASGNLYIFENNGGLKFVEYSSWTVTALNPGSYTVTDRNWSPRSMAYDTVNSILYIAATSDGYIAKYPSTTGKTLGTRSSLSLVTAAGASVGLYFPTGVALDSSQNVYICDRGNVVIRKWTRSTGFTTKLSLALGNSPVSITLDSSDNLYIVDSSHNVVQKVTASTGIMSVFAGTVDTACGPAPCGNGGAATSATLVLTGKNDGAFPALGVDTSNNIYFADYEGNSVRVISSSVSARCDSFRLLMCTCSCIYTLSFDLSYR